MDYAATMFQPLFSLEAGKNSIQCAVLMLLRNLPFPVTGARSHVSLAHWRQSWKNKEHILAAPEEQLECRSLHAQNLI